MVRPDNNKIEIKEMESKADLYAQATSLVES